MAPGSHSRSSTPESDLEDDSRLPVVAKIVTYTTTKSKTTTRKSKPKTTKETKTKNFRFAFAPTEEAYVELLKTILVKHHIKRLPDLVSKKKIYPMKIQVPPATKSDAEDVINVEEFKDIAKGLNKKPPAPPKAITIFVDMKEVENGLKKANNSSDSGSDEEEPGSDGSNDDDLTGPEQELARLRGMLREKYGNDRDNCLSYTDPTTGENVTLTVFMTKEWARALYDKVPGVSLSIPPNTAIFDLINRQAQIKKPRSSSESISPTSGGDASATQALGTLNSIFGVFNTLLQTHSQGRNPPVTPGSAITGNSSPSRSGASSPLANTPTKLTRFLKYAEQKGVEHITEREPLFKARGLGPDVIEHLSKADLDELGISRGDGIRLQRLAPSWWDSEKKGLVRKRKADDAFPHDDESPRRLCPAPQAPPVSIRFEKRWIDKASGQLLDGGASYFGSGFRLGQAHEHIDYCWWYFSQEVQALIPVPQGYLPVLEGDYAREIQVGDEDD
ncbi:hypothetical protein EST38_g9107 [Candolleomyces aberdarensis]|uniref:SAM domain-containing protein n=1 Tax=Candolleomyces aberdarensis TaxID=2316362 RepID=A0A4Q2DAY4_9AGAR|nr:hypothetical protein EST38_g9107 [Candolleomyces aberdarensis]